MEQKFHLFVRRHPNVGYTVSVLTHPFLTSFSNDIDAARDDIATAAAKLLAREAWEIGDRSTWWKDVRLRRIDLTLRALHQGRLLPTPMRFTVLTHPIDDDEGSARSSRGLRVIIPRLGLSGVLSQSQDLEAWVEEMVRNELFMCPLERLLDVAYDGEETVETLTVTYKPVTQRASRERDRNDENTPAPPPPELADASRRLNDLVRTNSLERAFQRTRELELLAEAVTSSRRASVLLVGASGVGKTALVHELTARFEDKHARPEERGVEVYSTNGSRIVAGMRYLGQWQERMQRMIQELRVRRAILHIESLSEFLMTGNPGRGLDAPRYLLPSIEAGEVTVICEATSDDLARAERTHPAFVRCLKALRIDALRGDGAMVALTSVANTIGRARGVRFTPESLVRAIDLTERFGDGAALPGGAVQLLRAAAHRDNVATEAADARKARQLYGADVTRAFCLRTGYPRELVDPAAPLDPDVVLERLRTRVVGQDGAVVLLRDLVVQLKTAMTDPSRPLGSFLLLGPTGVGKTESALALAEYLFGDSKRLCRFDMSEYAAYGSAARLVGHYGGAEGALTRRVREQPFGIVLFDEVEKADGSVHDLLLQILGEGRLTDGTGRTVSFRNTVVILTSNLGADTAARNLGFGSASAVRDVSTHYLSAAAAFFRPELLNRFDHVVPYHPLRPETVAIIARRAIARALEREGVARRNIVVHYDNDVVDRVASLGFDARYGARPLNRAIEHWIVGPLARLLAARSHDPPARIDVVVEGDGVWVRAA
jgi:ATP-dependent Clp protease ATP-binding subunit ClpC